MSQSSRLLELACEKLYWPHPSQIWQPSGAGPKVYAKLTEEKIGKTIRREHSDATGAKVGILAANPEGDATEAPLAIVCEFPRPVSANTIREIHRLAWSFSRARSLIVVEPQQLRVWSCCEPPDRSKDPEPVAQISASSLSEQAAQSLQWLDLVSGQFFEDRSSRFQRNRAGDRMLLSNLKEVRRQLVNAGLEQEIIHDLIARVIFIQFLLQKKDSNGTPALNPGILQELYQTGILSAYYENLASILENFDDTYQLFRWLNNKFNGDLFPGKGSTPEEREIEWQAEISQVRRKPEYLELLAQFVSGNLDMKYQQLCLWPLYSFDVIPLDFISSIYEEFVSHTSGDEITHGKPNQGVYYTPEYLVDFILDGVLPWEEENWNLNILDPACGSGIFLVKAFQRLIYRWEKSHKREVKPEVLKSILENNIFGIDIDPEAVRVASFSLYLTMLDNIDPLDYWENEVQFPGLRGNHLIHADFFTEDIRGFRSKSDARTYDLIVGNAPWGKGTVTKQAKNWASKHSWKIANENISTLFVSKALVLAKEQGIISMIQPAGTLLFSQIGKTAKEIQERIFKETKVEEIVNLSALRFKLFPKAVSPACILTLCCTQPDNQVFPYICPKLTQTFEDNYRIIIEPQDIHLISPNEALHNPTVWSTLMWGGRRDLSLIQRLNQAMSLEKLKNLGIAKTRKGICRSKEKRKELVELRDRRILDKRRIKLFNHSFLSIRSSDLPLNEDLRVDERDGTDFSAFQIPQLIIKMSWQSNSKRFKAVAIEFPQGEKSGILCSKSYVSVHIPPEKALALEAAWLSFNSKLAVYYLFLSSGRFASYRHEVNPSDLIRVPIPELNNFSLDSVSTLEDVDRAIRQAFSFKESDWVLVEDLFNYTLPDFKGARSSPGRRPTQRISSNSAIEKNEPELSEYCKYFIRVIKAGFGQEKQVCATIFREPISSDCLPVRLVAIHLNHSVHEGVKIETIDSQLLIERLQRLNKVFLTQRPSQVGGIFYQRVARLYESIEWNGVKVPTIYLIKPDRIRYWTCSMALRDADEVTADIFVSANEINVT